ncbi:MAG: DUF2970 domain-containing protein [Lautropia sp.]
MAPRDVGDRGHATGGDPGSGADLKHAVARSGSIAGTFKAVAASFFGVRGGKAHDADVAKLNPVHVVIVGLVCAAIFIGVLILAVRFAIGTATGSAG